MYFRQSWFDQRLASKKYAPESALNDTKLIGGDEIANKIWKPDTFFINEESSEVKQSFVRIKPSGEVLFSQRIIVSFVSFGAWDDYPWDVNLHTLEIESFGYTMEKFKYAWKGGPQSVQVSHDQTTFRDLGVVGHRARAIEASLSSGNYSTLWLDLCFTRHSTLDTVHRVFVPVALITCLALLSLVLPKTEVTGKTVVLALTSLAMIGLKTWLHNNLLHPVFHATRAAIYVNIHLAVIILLNINFVFSRLLTIFGVHSKEGEEIQMTRLEREVSTESANPLVNPATQLPWMRRVEMAASAIPPLLFALGQAAFWISISTLSPDDQIRRRCGQDDYIWL